MYAVYQPHGSVAAGVVVIAAGVYEVTPLKRRFRRRCRDIVRSGFQFGLCCAGSSIGLMLMLVAVGVMSLPWMSVIAVLVLAQKLLLPKAAIDVPLVARDRRARYLHRPRALLGSQAHATDVRRHRRRGPGRG